MTIENRMRKESKTTKGARITSRTCFLHLWLYGTTLAAKNGQGAQLCSNTVDNVGDKFVVSENRRRQ